MKGLNNYWNKLRRSVVAGQLSHYALLTLLQKGAGLLLLPLTTRYLSLSDYGVLESLTILMVFCSLLEVSAGALPKFVADYSRGQHGSLLSSSMALSLTLGAVLPLIVACFLSWAPLHLFSELSALHIATVALIVWLMILLQPLLMWLRIQQQVLPFCCLVGAQTVLQTCGTLFALTQGYGLEGILMASLVAHGCALVGALYLIWPEFLYRPQTRIMQQTLGYQWCLILASLALFVTHGLDRLLLGQWMGAETLARYGILIKLAEVVAVVFGVVETWWGARRFRVLKEHNGAHKVLQNHLNMLYFLCFLLLGALMAGPALLQAILPESYHAGLNWLPGILLAIGLKMATSIFDMGCYLADKPVWLSRINIATAALALLLYWFLIPLYQVWGLLLSVNLIYGIRLMVFAWLSQKFMPLGWRPACLLNLLTPLLGALIISVFPVTAVYQSGCYVIAFIWICWGGLLHLFPHVRLLNRALP